MSKRIELTFEDTATIATLKDRKLTEKLIIQQASEELIGLVSSREHFTLVIDFTEVEFLSTSFLGRLVSIKKAAVEHGTHLKLCSISKFIMELIHLVAFERIFEIHPSKTEASRAFSYATS